MKVERKFMAKIEAYQCVHCGSLYLSQKEMNKCRRECGARKKAEEKAKRIRENRQCSTDKIRLTVSDIDDIPSAVTKIMKEKFDRDVIFTKWNLRFRTDIAPTHSAPIGKKTDWNGSARYCGWTGYVTGTTNLNSRPLIKLPGYRDRMDSIFDVFSHYGSGLVSGINYGSGNGGPNFGFDVTIYLDDFPKLKSKYEEWLPLAAAKKELDKEISMLRGAAHKELIEKDQELLELKDVERILEARLMQVRATYDSTKVRIMNGAEYQKATTPKTKFDRATYDRLSRHFGKL